MPTLPARIRLHAERDPDALFCTLIAGETIHRMTFGDIYRHGLAYAGALHEAGVGRGEIVPIILRHGPHLLYAFVGAVLAGATPSFLPFPSAKQRADLYWRDHAALFERLNPRLIISYAEHIATALDALPNFSVETLAAGDDILSHAGFVEASVEALVVPDDIACLQHSSGTTGLKKGVMLTHREILQHVDTYAKALKFTSADSIVSWLPLYHDMGFIACFMGSLVQGTHLIALDPFEWALRPSILLDAIGAYRPTFCWLPNFAFTHLVNTAKRGATYDLSSIRAFINCSEPCKVETFERFLTKFGSDGAAVERLGVCYAMAENVFAVTQTPPGQAARVLEVDADEFAAGRVGPVTTGTAKRLLSCGPPVDGVRIRVVDALGGETDAGAIGEIHVTSPFLFSGYYLQPEVTARKLRDGWYATGDMGFMHEGEVYITGRVDDMLIVNGRNYYAHEIEAIVNDVDGIIAGRNVAIGIDDGRSDATVVVVLAECRIEVGERDLVQRLVRQEVFERLGLSLGSFVPLAAGSLIKTTSGKISRVENKKRYLESAFSELVG
jgi:acyl-CoA synthetase (AMP-forming)/AMP-acid ligase II